MKIKCLVYVFHTFDGIILLYGEMATVGGCCVFHIRITIIIGIMIK